jgi:hypothetical protein
MFEVPDYYNKFVLCPFFLLFVSYNGFGIVYDSLLYGFMMRRPSGVGSGRATRVAEGRYKTIRVYREEYGGVFGVVRGY